MYIIFNAADLEEELHPGPAEYLSQGQACLPAMFSALL